VLVTAAAWPRSVVTRYEALELERAVYAALHAADAPAARRLLAGAAARSHTSARLEVYRALLHVQEGDLERAIAIARPLAGEEDVAVRDEATRIVVGVAKALGYRLYAGDAGERNPWRGLAYMDEACRAGDAESCRNAARVRKASR
jgi:TPR repeat protein